METRSVSADQLTADEWQEILDITHAAFSEHRERGLHMKPCNVTLEEHQAFLEDCQVFQIKENNKLIAYKAGKIQTSGNHKFFQVRLTCVSPVHKGKGLGKKVHIMLEDWALAQGCVYLRTDTSCKAKSSYAYHHACGFEDWYFTHWRTTNYYSIVLRKELPAGKRMARRERYKSLFLSYITTHLFYDENGRERICSKWIRSLIRKKS